MKLLHWIWILAYFLNSQASILDQNSTYYQPKYYQIYDQVMLEEQQQQIKKGLNVKTKKIKKKQLTKPPKVPVQTSQPKNPPSQVSDPNRTPPLQDISSFPQVTATRMPPLPHILPSLIFFYLIASIFFSVCCINPTCCLLQGYLIYLFLTLTFTSPILTPITSTPASLQHLPSIYLSHLKSNPYFLFKIQCLHYEQNKKMVTCSKQEKYYPMWRNLNGELKPLSRPTQRVLVDFRNIVKFQTKRGRRNLDEAWTEFLDRNDQDEYEQSSNEYQVQGLNIPIEFVGDKAKEFSKGWAMLFIVLGLDFPYTIYKENSISRYQIKIKKLIK